MIALDRLTAREAGALVAAGEVSCAELVETSLARIERTEPLLRAYAHVAAGEARAEAAQLDAERARGRLRGPLHGVPFAVKDVLDTAGLPAESGSRALRGRVATADAGAVRLLREAGCVLLGKLVTTELAMRYTEPATRNPWRPDCYPGGSSAGAGAAVAAGTALLALGTDAGGSVRVPAALCGVVGLYPSEGRVPLDGYPAASPWIDGIGPLTRSVDDCALVFDALAADTRGATAGLGQPLGEARIGVDRAFLDGVPLADGVRERFTEALAALAEAGCRIEEVTLPGLEEAEGVLAVLRGAGAAAALAELVRTDGDRLAEGTLRALEAGARITPAALAAAQAGRARLQAAFGQAVRAAGLAALALPTLPGALYTAAAVVAAPRLEIGRFTLLANALGCPAVSVPCGLTAGGVPAGLQLLGLPGSDERLLRLAAAHEQVAGRPGCPPAVAGTP